LKKIINLYIEEDELTDELFKSYANDTIDETQNTILGHCVEELPNEFKNFVMSPPLNLDKTILARMVRNNDHIIKRYSTSSGNFYSIAIFLNKITNLLGE
jgi:hypothetical protein